MTPTQEISTHMKDIMTQNLLPQFADTVRSTVQFDPTVGGFDHPLMIDAFDASGKKVEMLYAPFDHINANARIAIVGMTPGAHQANQAVLAAKQALLRGASIEEAGRLAKTHASFSGEPMRTNLIRMMDRIGIARLLSLTTTEGLWGSSSNLVHFTSALRYPVFVDGRNWSGTPDIVRTPKLREWLVKWTGAELAGLKNCIIVPLGPKVAAAIQYLAEQGLIDASQIMDGMPHPSGANQERVAYFLGDKTAERCSVKTNPLVLDASRAGLINKVNLLGLRS